MSRGVKPSRRCRRLAMAVAAGGTGLVGAWATGAMPAEALSLPGSVTGLTTSAALSAGGLSPSVAGVDACPSPAVTGVATADGRHSASPGQTVYVTGSGLSGPLCTVTVTVAGAAVKATADSATQIQFTMPGGTPGGSVRVVVTDALGDTSLSNANFNVVTVPTIAELLPADPSEDAPLTVSGNGFGVAQLSGASVLASYCGGPAQAAEALSASRLQVPGPAAYCDGPLTLEFLAPYDTAAGSTSPPIGISVPAGTVDVAPVVSAVSPSGPVHAGEVLTVTGSGFGPTGTASIGGVAVPGTWSDRVVTLTVPSGAAGQLQLLRADGVTVTAGTVEMGGVVTAVGSGSGLTGAPSIPVGSSPTGRTPRLVALSVAEAAPAAAGAVFSPASGSIHGSEAGPVPSGSLGPASGGFAPGAVGAAAGSSSPPALNGSGSRIEAITSPRSPFPLLPLPWALLMVAILLAAAVAGQSLFRRQGVLWLRGGDDRRSPADAGSPTGSSLAWRAVGYAAAALLLVTYLLTATSVLMTLVTEWLPGSSSATLPGGQAYKATAVVLSVLLSGIAVRYVYYYRCWLSSRKYFARAPKVDVAVLAGRILPHLKFQVTTRGGALPIVERTVQGIVDIAAAQPWLAPRMSVEVITESAEEADHLPRHFASANIPVAALCLPAGYRTPNGTGLKARAMHYMVERRLAGWNAVAGRSFIVHLDEETLVTEDHLLVLVDYLSDNPAPVSQGPILYPLEWDKAPWMCRAMESLRPFGCSECARVMSNPPPPHLHGSNLVVDEAVENEIGWDFGTIDGQPYIAEDLLFGLRAYSILGKEGFGWHGATMLEQPPLSVYWAIQQRLRWVLGALQGWRAMGQREDLRSIPAPQRRKLRVAVGFRVGTYALGFPIGFAGLFFFLHPAIRQAALSSPLGVWRAFILLAGAGWVASYQIGLARNLRYQQLSRLNRLRQHLTILLLTPISGLFETAGPFIALTRWLIGARQAKWTPTPKTSEPPAPEPILQPARTYAGPELVASSQGGSFIGP